MTELVLRNGDIAIATLRKPEVLEYLTSQYSSDRLLILKVDVTKSEEIISAFAQAERKFGRVDVVFNNAGYAIVGEAESTAEDVARHMFDTNFWGAVNVSKEAVRFFREVNKPAGGRLLQVSSLSGIQSIPGMSYYSATKHALEGFSDSLAAELDPQWNIKVTVVEFGAFLTEGVSRNMESAPQDSGSRKLVDIKSITLRDPEKAVEAIYKISIVPEPPLHFPLGKDSVEGIRSTVAKLLSYTDQYESWSEGLDIVN